MNGVADYELYMGYPRNRLTLIEARPHEYDSIQNLLIIISC